MTNDKNKKQKLIAHYYYIENNLQLINSYCHYHYLSHIKLNRSMLSNEYDLCMVANEVAYNIVAY